MDGVWMSFKARTVTNRVDRRSVVERIDDRGPFYGERSIDLSAGTARAIGITGTGAVALAVVQCWS